MSTKLTFCADPWILGALSVNDNEVVHITNAHGSGGKPQQIIIICIVRASCASQCVHAAEQYARPPYTRTTGELSPTDITVAFLPVFGLGGRILANDPVHLGFPQAAQIFQARTRG